MQRTAVRRLVELIPLLQDMGIRVVMDIDDRFDKIHRSHQGWHTYDPRFSPDINYDWMSRGCQMADLVTVSTPALLHRFGMGHGVVLPNLVPQSYLEIQRRPMRKTIG